MTTIQLEKVTLADLPTLRKISIATFTDTFGAQNTPENLAAYLTAAYAPAKLQQELTEPASQFYFVYVDQQLAGYLKINHDAAQTEAKGGATLEVERIYILPAFKRHGLGRYLIKQAETSAQQLGKTAIWLGVWENNFAAQQFYAKLGFVRTGQHSFVMGTDPQTDFILTKQL
ncbi:GNAT family N-acetyltransferase [Loigolactobacillus jiayinensis]|uniref:GNAT family N-acetyltransferase n=1 Tax=Loigolactobacillus jiayinensis TaxID=2486016 RepID=A0ABW1RAA2_9LACO|nr:GNAT family N-acetyltransferase [Loigolactobacillus jiayinensis]